MHESKIHLCKMSHAGDTDEFRALLDDGVIELQDVRGIMITHEGDLVANAYAARAYAEVVAQRLGRSVDDVVEDFPIQAMAGAVGFMTPHTAILTRRDVPGDVLATGNKRLAVAGTCTRRFLPEEVGTAAYINEIRDRVQELYAELEVESPSDVGIVFAKAPWPSARHGAQAAKRGASLRSDDFWTSGEYGRGGAALGVGAGLGEFDEGLDLEKILLEDADVYSEIAHCSSTEERQSVALTMFANTRASVSPTVVGRCLMSDGLDADSPRALAAQLIGVSEAGDVDMGRVEYAFLKPKTAEAADLRGERHTLKDHPTVGYMWWMIEKAPVHGVVASALDQPAIEVATGPEHQGPVGRPLLAIVARVDG